MNITMSIAKLIELVGECELRLHTGIPTLLNECDGKNYKRFRLRTNATFTFENVHDRIWEYLTIYIAIWTVTDKLVWYQGALQMGCEDSLSLTIDSRYAFVHDITLN